MCYKLNCLKNRYLLVSIVHKDYIGIGGVTTNFA